MKWLVVQILTLIHLTVEVQRYTKVQMNPLLKGWS